MYVKWTCDHNCDAGCRTVRGDLWHCSRNKAWKLVNLARTESGSKVLVTDCMVNLLEYLQNDRPRREIAAEWKLLQAASRLEQAHNVLILIVTRSANIQTFAITRFILWLQTACCTYIIYRNLFTLYSNEGKQWMTHYVFGGQGNS